MGNLSPKTFTTRLSPRTRHIFLPVFQHAAAGDHRHSAHTLCSDMHRLLLPLLMVIPGNAHRHIDFPGKDQGEEFQFYFRQHWIRLWWPFCKMMAWMIAIGAGVYLAGATFGASTEVNMRHAVLLILCLCLLYAQFSFLSAFYKYFLYVIIVTDKKVHRIKKTLMIVDDHQSIDLWTLEDITKNQHGLVQNLLGFGTLVLVMPQDALRIHFTPFISTKHEMIMRLREQARLRISPQQIIVPPSPPPEQKAEKTDEVKDL